MNPSWRAFWFGLVGLFLGACLVWWGTPRPRAPAPWPVPQVVQKVKHSVVVVLTSRTEPGRGEVQGIGSGVVLTAQGDIVTNYHVVAGARQVTVVLSTGQRYSAQIVGTDPPTDLALLRIHPKKPLVPLPLANSRRLQPGELVVAIGHSLGLTHTVTVGVISATNRTLYRDGWEYRLIQTDAAINPGNSGGALVNMHGQLIGINSSKIAQAGVEGIGFAVPAQTVQYVTNQLLRYGRVRRPWLGVVVQSLARSTPGLWVAQVADRSPAFDAGIRAGDFITQFNRRPVYRLRQLMAALQAVHVGQRVPVTVLRGPRSWTVWVTVSAIPGAGVRLRQTV
jgi:serine protease Do